MSDLRPVPDPEEDLPEPPRLRALRRLVTLLTAALIVGVVTVAGALVIRLTRAEAPPFDPRALRAEAIALPEGEAVTAAGAGPGALILVTRDGAGRERMRLYDPETGTALRAIDIRREPR